MSDATLVTIASDRLSAAINPFGAELTHLRDAEGRELMTDADPAFWSRHAPLLFPVIGRVHDDAIRVDGTAYPMPKHGFARNRTFEMVANAADCVTFRLEADAETRESYPFAFVLDVTYRIDGATLAVDVTIANRGDRPMPAQFGFHPAFAWPLPYGRARADHRIVFDADEPDALSEVTKAGFIGADTRPSPLDARTLYLADDLFTNDALVWDPVASDSVTYGANDGPQLRIAFPDTPKLGIWTIPGAAYVCVEPWHGIADPAGFTGDYADKPGIFTVMPGETKAIGLRVSLVEEP